MYQEKTHIIITMAGNGKRFQDAGYNKPKYQISAHGKTLFEWSIISLRQYIDNQCPFYFIVKKADKSQLFIEAECKKLEITNFHIIELDHITKGQAETVLFAENFIQNTTEPILIHNIDTHVNSNCIPIIDYKNTDGWIPCFKAYDNKWSFVKTNESGYATEVREKQPISDNATIGLYGFKSFQIYKEIYTEYYSNPQNIEQGELYIAPLYNALIAKKSLVSIAIIDQKAIVPLGTPQDLKKFIKENSYEEANIYC